ncbi:MAG: hypothetical protein ACYTGP_09895 [Planctomycetota bacterium]|jgi:hypothetical protein
MTASIGSDPRSAVHPLLAAQAFGRGGKSAPVKTNPPAPPRTPAPAPAPAPTTDAAGPVSPKFAARARHLAGRTLVQGAENILQHVHQGVGRFAASLGLDASSAGPVAELLDSFHAAVKEQVHGALSEPGFDVGSIAAGFGSAFNDLRAGLQDLLAGTVADRPRGPQGVDVATRRRPAAAPVSPARALHGLAAGFENDLRNLVSALQNFAPPSSPSAGFDVAA